MSSFTKCWFTVVLRSQVQKYKEVFIEAVRQANKIDSALSVYFGDVTPVTNNGG